MLRQALRDVFIETNGNVRYEDFCLKEVMPFFGKVNQRILSSGKLRRIFSIQPDNSVLTDRYFFHNPESGWKNNYDPLQRVPWIKVEIAKGFPLEAVVLPEFQN